ncbi:chloride channel protein [Sphingobacterium corticibacterium]|uniref:Chloride channel protein n=1 Tax=Sphingobacterium corticibacterium TaxID=2484746 RepID=A0A4Q6XN79_9SPHI|nr:chloride channel protein [Sphingobacterium corticibacterium]RZF61361.1 chloride channel protein [Sphingobacterium corticibacterium]
MDRKKIIKQHYWKLAIVSIGIALVCCLLAYTLKHATEWFEVTALQWISQTQTWLFLLFPSVGITAIYFLRKWLFQNRKNKGLTEIFKTLDDRKDHLPLFKIPSHYINGFLTVVFGGSTGVEVSTVVATASIGNAVYEKHFAANMYKRELICAAVTAGVAVLFGSPFAGWLFAMEVVARKINKTLVLACTTAALTAGIFVYFFDSHPFFNYAIQDWYTAALPFFIVLSVFCGLLSTYFTLLVTRMKAFFGKITNNFIRVNLGALIVGGLIFYFPLLYGDSYHGLKEVVDTAMKGEELSFGILLFIALLKPLAASLTLGAGGDGGVFAPSIVAGALLGLGFALACNTYFGTDLVLFNFILAGAAATLSASIYAPFTALFLVCGLVSNGFELFLPILIVSFVSKYAAQWVLPYNAYTYDQFLEKRKVVG